MRSPNRYRLDVDERRAQLLDVGQRLFREHSYDDVSIDTIAAAAGISKGLLYHYFPTKRDFYVATLNRVADELRAHASTDPGLPGEERLRLGLCGFLAYVDQHAAGYLALLRGGIGADQEVAAIVDGVREHYVRELLGGMGVDVPTSRLRLALRGWVGFVEALSVEWVASQATEEVVAVEQDDAVALAERAFSTVLDVARGEGIVVNAP